MNRTPPDTPRLVEQPEEGGELLRDLLASAGSDGPSAAQAERVIAALDSALPITPGPGLGSPAAAAKAAGAGALGLGKLAMLSALALGGLGVGAALLSSPADSPAPKPAVSSSVSAPVAPIAQPSANMLVAEAAPLRGPATSAQPTVASPTPAASASAAPRWSSETELLSAAQRALSSGQSAAALALSEEHRRTFPRGAFREELERIAIEALLRQGQHQQAAARATLFFKRFPSSVHRPRLEGLLGARDPR